MFDDIFKIVTALIGVCTGVEAEGGSSDEKQARAIAQIMVAIKGEGGIHVTNKWVLQGLDFLLPLLIKYVVARLNASGFFAK